MKKNFWLTVGLLMLSITCYGLAADDPGIPARQNVSKVPQKMPPGIMFSTILNNVGLHARTGRFTLKNQMQNVFMQDGSNGKVVLSRQDGPEFCHWLWTLDTFGLKPPYKLFAFKQPLNPAGGNFPINDLKLTTPGNYTLDFFVGGEKFYMFPFSVKTIEPESAFDGETIYVLDGAWNDWGYLFYGNADPEQNLIWKIWLREPAYTKKDHKVRVEVIRDRDKKLICQSRENTTYNFQHEWVRYQFDLVNPPVKTSGGAYFKAKDLLAVDGPYTLKMTIDGNLYGLWKFSINGGKPNYTTRTVRGEADPMTFVEGGKDAWWYMKEGG